jgi:hypothetical protein
VSRLEISSWSTDLVKLSETAEEDQRAVLAVTAEMSHTMDGAI